LLLFITLGSAALPTAAPAGSGQWSWLPVRLVTSAAWSTSLE